jgi:hypothetical protein
MNRHERRRANMAATTGKRPYTIRHPLLIVFEEDDALMIGVHPRDGCRTVRAYGKLVAHLVHHIANSVEPAVQPATVWGWVDAARNPNAAVRVWRPTVGGDMTTKMVLCAEPDRGEVRFCITASAWKLPLEELAKIVVAVAEAIVAQLRANADQLWYWIERERTHPTKKVKNVAVAPADLPPELRPLIPDRQ